LDGTTIRITDVFKSNDENRLMRRLYCHNCGYACARVVNDNNWLLPLK
jgi:hypothetical protein